MLERLVMLFVVCGAFGMTDLAGVRPASGFWMLARILCHIHVSDVVHVFVFGFCFEDRRPARTSCRGAATQFSNCRCHGLRVVR